MPPGPMASTLPPEVGGPSRGRKRVLLAALPVLFAVKAGNNPVAEAGCGVSVDPGDPVAISAGITQLTALSEEARQAMGERGRAYVVQRHGYRHLAQEYLHLLPPGAA